MKRRGIPDKFPWVVRKEQILEILKCWKFGNNPELSKIPKIDLYENSCRFFKAALGRRKRL